MPIIQEELKFLNSVGRFFFKTPEQMLVCDMCRETRETFVIKCSSEMLFHKIVIVIIVKFSVRF